MTATALLDVLRIKRVRLSIEGGQLAADAPKGMLTDALRQAIRQHKAELHALVELREERAALIEYDGRLPHAEAEHLAWACVMGEERLTC